MQLWLALGPQPDTRIRLPATCPHPGCGGRRFRLHQVVAKRVRDAVPLPPTPTPRAGSATVPPSPAPPPPPLASPARATAAPRVATLHRYTCRRCRRTFRAYPAGVDRGGVSTGVQRMAAALRLLGLSFRDVSRALAVLGVTLGKSQAQALVAPRLRGLERRGSAIAPLFKRVAPAGQPGRDRHPRDGARRRPAPAGLAPPPTASVWIHGRQLALRRAVDPRGRVALVVDDIDRETRRAVDAWVRDTLRGFGIDVEVVFPTRRARRPGTAARRGPRPTGRGRRSRPSGRRRGPQSRAEGGGAAPVPNLQSAVTPEAAAYPTAPPTLEGAIPAHRASRGHAPTRRGRVPHPAGATRPEPPGRPVPGAPAAAAAGAGQPPGRQAHGRTVPPDAPAPRRKTPGARAADTPPKPGRRQSRLGPVA